MSDSIFLNFVHQTTQQLSVTKMQTFFVAALLVVLCAAAKQEPENDPSWKINYKPWRQRDSISLEEWRKNIPPPRSTLPPQTWAGMDIHQRRSHFSTCIKHEAVSLTQRIPSYKSPDLMDVQRVRSLGVTHMLRSWQALGYHTLYMRIMY